MKTRFSRSEIKVMHLAIFTICVGIVMFFVTAKTLLIPAIRSSYLKPTVNVFETLKVVCTNLDQS